ncbi:NTP transferase domain-containing protein [bacterium]|nr:NTP transferase domain-containing protein [bacterium]
MTPKVLAVIPARAGNDKIPYLNIKPLNGIPLLAYTIRAARECDFIHRIFVSTDDSRIRAISQSYGASVPVLRPRELSQTNRSLDDVVRHALEVAESMDRVAYDVVVLLPCSTPFRTARHIEDAWEKFREDRLDALFSVTEEDGFLWTEEGGVPRPLHDVEYRNLPRIERERRRPIYLENGAIYIYTRKNADRRQRYAGRLGMHLLPRQAAVSVHSLNDFWMAEQMLQGPRIMFKTDGSAQMGMGHVVSSLRIADEIKRRSSAIMRFLITQADTPAAAEIQSRGYDLAVCPEKDGSAVMDEIIKFSPNVVVNDLPILDEDYLAQLKAFNVFTVNVVDSLDDIPMDLTDTLTDVIVSYLKSNVDPPVPCYSGPSFAALGREFAERAGGRTRGFRKNVRQLLITFGGSDPNGLTLKAVEAAAELGAAVDVKIVLGPAFAHEQGLESLLGRISRPFEILRQMKDMGATMSGADVAVCGGGLTLHELACFGIPAVVISQNDREAQRVQKFMELGTIEYLGNESDVSVEDIRSALRRLAADSSRRKKMSRNGRLLYDGRGVERIVDIILRSEQAAAAVA